MPSHSPAPDRRSARRYNLSLPIEVGLPGQDRTSWIRGTVRDISTQGIYFASDKKLEPGSEVKLRVAITDEMMAIDAVARVVRVESRGNARETPIGVAVTLESVEIRRNGAPGN